MPKRVSKAKPEGKKSGASEKKKVKRVEKVVEEEEAEEVDEGGDKEIYGKMDNCKYYVDNARGKDLFTIKAHVNGKMETIEDPVSIQARTQLTRTYSHTYTNIAHTHHEHIYFIILVC